MQRVVRSSLVGLLTIAGLVACGDKVTVTETTTPPPKAVRGVTVSPEQLTLPVNGTATLAASVNADEGVTDRTVTWASSNTAIATVDAASGLVRGVAVGTTTIRATSKADAQVSGAASVTVTGSGGPGLPPTVTVSSINQTNPLTGVAFPANLNGAAGQLDVVLNVETNGQQLRSVTATLSCPGSTTMTQTQTISGAVQADVDASAAAAPVTLSFNTGLFNTTTGVPQLRNGQCSLTASATTGPTGSTQTQTATINTGLVLANVDGVVLSAAFSPFTNAEGLQTVTSAVDAAGLPWRGGNVTVTALPVLYSGRQIFGGGTPGSLTITLPGATNATQVITPTAAGPVTATYSATSGSGPRVTGLTITCTAALATSQCAPVPPGANTFPNEANGTTPLGVVPNVIALDNAGNDIPLAVLNYSQPSLNLPNPAFRLDNTPVQAPTSFIIAPRQAGWVSGLTMANFSPRVTPYVFTGDGAGAGLTAPTGAGKYVSCGDSPSTGNAAGAGYTCAAQAGVSRGAVDDDAGTNGLTTFSYYAIPAASYSPASAGNGTSTSATACSISGSWQKIDNAAGLAASLANTAYVVRVFEKDRMGNARCTDLAAAPNTINSGSFARGTFGVDNLAPTANYVERSADATAANNNQAVGAGEVIANYNVKIALSDDASGFSGTPVLTNVRRFAIDPATNAPGSFNSAFGCPVGRAGNGNCTTFNETPQNLPVNPVRTVVGGVATYPSLTTVDGVNGSGCAGCGYFLFAQTAFDLARNLSATIGGTAAPTISTGPGSTPAPAGFRQVVVDQQAPTVGGIAVPASITGGASASFATSAADNLDLISSNYTLTYGANPAGNPAGVTNLPIRANGPALGVAFDNTLTNASSFSVNVPFFIRSIATTAAGTNAPQNNGGAGLPNQIAVRAYDAPSNASAPGAAAIAPANVPQNNRTDFTQPAPGANPAAIMYNFAVANGATLVSNCPAAGCTGGTAANPQTVTLVAQAVGAEGPTFQFVNPFTQVQFYYFDPSFNEYVLIGSAVAPVVTDNATVTQRTFTWTLSTPFDPPLTAGDTQPLRVIAIGVNSQGDGLATNVNANIQLTNP